MGLKEATFSNRNGGDIDTVYYGKLVRILLEIAPVSITETCLHKGVEGDNRKAGVSVDRGKRKGLHQMDCYGSAISTSLAGCGDFFLGYWICFFLQNYVVVIERKKNVGVR